MQSLCQKRAYSEHFRFYWGKEVIIILISCLLCLKPFNIVLLILTTKLRIFIFFVVVENMTRIASSEKCHILCIISLQFKKPEWKPDYGPAEFLPTWGATIAGARKFLIAYNINILGTKEQAHRLALNLRTQGRGPDQVLILLLQHWSKLKRNDFRGQNKSKFNLI